MRRGIVRLSLVFLYLFVAPVANAQEQKCAPHDVIANMLASQYKETRLGMGMVGDKAMVEAFSSEAGTWTILGTNTNGMSCIIAAGDNWEFSTETIKPGQGT